MRRRAVTIEWDRPTLRLYTVGDVHVGSAVCDEAKVRRLAEIIAEDDDALVVGLGDFVEAIAWDDVRYDPAEMAEFVEVENLKNIFYCQAAHFAKQLFAPTMGKWAMVIPGNHESRAASRYHTDPAALIAGFMACPYQGQSDEAGWLRIKMKANGKTRNVIDVYCQHGWGGGELRGSDALKLERLLYRKNADAVLTAHRHRAMTFPVSIEQLGRTGWEEKRERWGVISYPMIGKHGYIARKGGNAPPMGYAVLTIERVPDVSSARLGAELKQL